MADEKDTTNEITAAARDAKHGREAASGTSEPARAPDRRWPLKKIGIGIGSAAVAGAMLYAAKAKRKD